jgi:hypothetical protein
MRPSRKGRERLRTSRRGFRRSLSLPFRLGLIFWLLLAAIRSRTASGSRQRLLSLPSRPPGRMRHHRLRPRSKRRPKIPASGGQLVDDGRHVGRRKLVELSVDLPPEAGIFGRRFEARI